MKKVGSKIHDFKTARNPCQGLKIVDCERVCVLVHQKPIVD